jgi:enamine deaminase RidA (YjgF/YER057c/UK114 family)
MNSKKDNRLDLLKHALFMLLALFAQVNAHCAQFMDKTPFQIQRSYSPGVVTQGGKTIWVSGQTALVDADGRDISNQFEPQAKQVFIQIEKILSDAGAGMGDIVQMMVFVRDSKDAAKLQEMRKALFKNNNFPASSLITAAGFARPGIEVEIQVVAVLADTYPDQK